MGKSSSVSRNQLEAAPIASLTGFVREGDHSLTLGHILSTIALSDRDFVQRKLKSAWLHVLDAIICNAHCALSAGSNDDSEDSLELWHQIGEKFGFKEEPIRKEARFDRVETTPAMLGCNWLKCPLYKVELSDAQSEKMLRCVRCRKVCCVRRFYGSSNG